MIKKKKKNLNSEFAFHNSVLALHGFHHTRKKKTGTVIPKTFYLTI